MNVIYSLRKKSSKKLIVLILKIDHKGKKKINNKKCLLNSTILCFCLLPVFTGDDVNFKVVYVFVNLSEITIIPALLIQRLVILVIFIINLIDFQEASMYIHENNLILIE